MKLVHYHINEHFDFSTDKINVLCIEKPTVFRKYFQEILNQVDGYEGKFTLSADNNILKIYKHVEVITSIFPFELNKKTLLSKIYKLLEETAMNEDNYEKTLKLKLHISEYIMDLSLDTNIDIGIDSEFSMAGLLKSIDIEINETEKEEIEKIYDYIDISNQLFSNKIFVFVNLKTFFSGIELDAFFRSILDHGYRIFLLESGQPKESSKYEKIVFIDGDLCEIVF